MDSMPPPREPELPSRQVEADLRRRCQAGEWAPGERLPAVADLAQHYGVARNTVIKALRRLADDGLIEIVPSWGTFRART
jgi:GntR family transcriptional regulator